MSHVSNPRRLPDRRSMLGKNAAGSCAAGTVRLQSCAVRADCKGSCVTTTKIIATAGEALQLSLDCTWRWCRTHATPNLTLVLTFSEGDQLQGRQEDGRHQNCMCQLHPVHASSRTTRYLEKHSTTCVGPSLCDGGYDDLWSCCAGKGVDYINLTSSLGSPLRQDTT